MLKIQAQDSPRLRYVLDEIFQRRLNLSFEFTPKELNQNIEISFAKKSVYTLEGHKLLWEDKLLSKQDFKELIKDFDSIDPLTKGFIFLSRYEEYLSPTVDKWDRYTHVNSLFDLNLKKPWVEIWTKELKEQLEEHFGKELGRFSPLTHEFTMDVDVAYSVKGKSKKIFWGGQMKALLKGNFASFVERNKIRKGLKKDRYDSYDFVGQSFHKKNSRVFFLLGDRGPMDKNLSHESDEMKSLVQLIEAHSNVGIHPSFASFQKPELIKKEISRLEKLTGKKIQDARFHYLRFNLPKSYQQLSAIGIKRDHSMGYADQIGFRAGTAYPFNFFDLDKNQSCDLEIHPIAYMDGTLKEYMGLSVSDAKSLVNELIDNCTETGGKIACLWHNDTLAEAGDWKGWREVFEMQAKLSS